MMLFKQGTLSLILITRIIWKVIHNASLQSVRVLLETNGRKSAMIHEGEEEEEVVSSLARQVANGSFDGIFHPFL